METTTCSFFSALALEVHEATRSSGQAGGCCFILLTIFLFMRSISRQPASRLRPVCGGSIAQNSCDIVAICLTLANPFCLAGKGSCRHVLKRPDAHRRLSGPWPKSMAGRWWGFYSGC